MGIMCRDAMQLDNTSIANKQVRRTLHCSIFHLTDDEMDILVMTCSPNRLGITSGQIRTKNSCRHFNFFSPSAYIVQIMNLIRAKLVAPVNYMPNASSTLFPCIYQVPKPSYQPLLKFECIGMDLAETRVHVNYSTVKEWYPIILCGVSHYQQISCCVRSSHFTITLF